jgi:glycosyltransferase involved in cell wall biosynthesis
MTSGRPEISVILPVYNGEVFVVEALESVFRQGYDPLEVIVVDDGSTDRTGEIVRGYGDRVRYCHQDNAGPAAARNVGLRAASGEVFAFIDADDLWPEGKLNLQMARFEENPSLEVVVGRVQYFVLTQSPTGRAEFVPFQAPVLGANLGAGLYKKSVFQKLGYFDAAFRFCEDVDLFLRIREERVPMLVVDAVTLFYRLHDANMSRERAQRNEVFLRALKHSLDRRREGNQPQPGSLSALTRELPRRP